MAKRLPKKQKSKLKRLLKRGALKRNFNKRSIRVNDGN